MSLLKRSFAAAGTAAAALAVVALAAGPAAADSPYRNWVQYPNNRAGVVFHPYGDKFELWDNVYNDGQRVHAEFHYKGVSDPWMPVRGVQDGHRTVQWNLHERINGRGAQIYLRVCMTYAGCSDAVRYRTYGR
jgi:hypothetical protein